MLEQYDGKLPKDYAVVFANTGKEHEATLEFVREISNRWKVDIHWIEYFNSPATTDDRQYQQVQFRDASRNGEPFAKLCEDHNYLPRREERMCTQFLKVIPGRQFVEKRFGWTRGTELLGFRADEISRLSRAKMRCGRDKEPWLPEAPLIGAGIDKASVMAFWRDQPFDLKLPSDLLGNCDMCFLKGTRKLRQIAAEFPERVEWWKQLEARHMARNTHRPANRTILPDGGYATLESRVKRQIATELGEEDLLELECYCFD